MSISRRTTTFVVCLMLLLLPPVTTRAAEPGWSGEVIARGERRAQISAKPMIHRPYRPFHFYGNTVRRWHYRGQVRPQVKDVRLGTRALVSRR